MCTCVYWEGGGHDKVDVHGNQGTILRELLCCGIEPVLHVDVEASMEKKEGTARR